MDRQPIWFYEHIKQHDPDCSDVALSTHSCSECSLYSTAYKIDGIGETAQLDYGLNPYNFTRMCGLWVTPDALRNICNNDSLSDVSDEILLLSAHYASEILFRLSGKQYNGICERVLYPGCLDPTIDCLYNNQYAPVYNSGCTVDTMSCFVNDGICNYSTLRLPGPINQIAEVVIDGKVLPREDYRIVSHRNLVLVNGEQWPKYNDFSRSPYKKWPPTPTQSTNSTKSKTWIDDWSLDSGIGLTTEVRSHEWTHDFLARNPHISLPAEREWVDTWLNESGLKFVKLTTPCDNDSWMISPTTARSCGAFPANQCCAKNCGGVCGGFPTNHCCGRGCGVRGCSPTAIVVDLSKCECSTQPWAEKWLTGEGRSVDRNNPSSWQEDYLLKNNKDIDLDSNCSITGTCCRDACNRNKNPDTGAFYICVCEDKAPPHFTSKECGTCHLGANPCCKEVLQRPNFCCGCPKCNNTPKPKCECPTRLPIASGLDTPDTPWWIKQWMYPDKYPKIENLNTDTFINWTHKFLQTNFESRSVTSWVLDYLDNHRCLSVDNAFVDIDSQYESHCNAYRWNNPPTDAIRDLFADFEYDPCKPAWLVRYYQGKEVPISGQLAALLLAREVAKAICSDGCIPSGLDSITSGTSRGSITMAFSDIVKKANLGSTGIYEVDLFIASVNPGRLTRRASVHGASRKRRSMVSVRE